MVQLGYKKRTGREFVYVESHTRFLSDILYLLLIMVSANALVGMFDANTHTTLTVFFFVFF